MFGTKAAVRSLAIAGLLAIAAAIFWTGPPARRITTTPQSASASKPIEWRPSKWSDALAKKAHRRLLSHDPGITGFRLPSRGCKDCDGMGGHYIPEKSRREGDSDMTTCDTCQGSGDADVD